MSFPVGTITFLFSDIEGSTRLWEKHPVSMAASLARHDGIMRAAMKQQGGYVFKTAGDAFCVAFDTAASAVEAAVESQRTLHSEPWGDTGPLRVRIAIHTGAAEFRDGDYFGNPLNRVARILAAAHGGQVLLSLPVQELVRDAMPAEVTLRDLGERRLRDLARPEHLFQILVDGHPMEFPPLRSLEVMPNNLPGNLSSFVGREREMQHVRDMLRGGRLLTLTGTGGTGKTRLALELGAEVLTDFVDGVWFVELAPVSDPSRVIDTVAAAIDIREDPDVPLQLTVRRALSQKQMLVIVDNCEHLHTACADFAADVLRHCPGVKLLTTSRHSLGISGEIAWAVPPLSTINPSLDLFQVSDPAHTVSQYESVKLFIDRAVSVNPAFRVTKQNAPAIAQICWRLDGIPLAIELAAARARVLAPEQIAARLDDRFRLLTGGNRSVLPHQQTLRTLIDWSYDLLSESERVLFRRLGAFGGGRTIEAIEAVCTGDGVDAYDALDLLQQLVDKSLLSVESGDDDIQRYTMIESVWQYSRDKLAESGEMEALRNRHLTYFLEIAELAGPAMDGADIAVWLERVDAERNNFRLALEWAATSSSHGRSGLRLVGLLTRYWEIRGHLKEAKHYFTRMLELPENQEITKERASAIAGAARIAWVMDISDEAADLYQKAVEINEALGDKDAVLLNRAFLAFNFRNLGNSEEAEQIFDSILAEGTTMKNQLIVAVALSGKGSVAMDRGDNAASRRLKEESLAIYRSSGNKWITAYLLWGLARSCLSSNDAASARRALDEWIAIATELKNRWAMAYILFLYAETLRLENEKHASARILGAAMTAREALGLNFDLVDQRESEIIATAIRDAMLPEEFDAAIATGRNLAISDALDYARGLCPTSMNPA